MTPATTTRTLLTILLSALAAHAAGATSHRQSGAAAAPVDVAGVVIDLRLAEDFPLDPDRLWAAGRLAAALADHVTMRVRGASGAEEAVLAHADLSVYNRPGQLPLSSKSSSDTRFPIESARQQPFSELFWDAEDAFRQALEQLAQSWVVLGHNTQPPVTPEQAEAVGGRAVFWDKGPADATHAFRIEVVGRDTMTPGSALIIYAARTPSPD